MGVSGLESDEHLRLFKCLIDTGAVVLRRATKIRLQTNCTVEFQHFLENNKHFFYHQVEKRNNCCRACRKPCSPCNIQGKMDKKIFDKVYNNISYRDNTDCLDRYEVKNTAIKSLDLSDLNFFLWNKGSLSPLDESHLKQIMKIRSAICHPESTAQYSILELSDMWDNLTNALLHYADEEDYKEMVEMQIDTLKKSHLTALETEKVLNKITDVKNEIMESENRMTSHHSVVEIKLTEAAQTINQQSRANTEDLKKHVTDKTEITKEKILEEISSLNIQTTGSMKDNTDKVKGCIMSTGDRLASDIKDCSKNNQHQHANLIHTLTETAVETRNSIIRETTTGNERLSKEVGHIKDAQGNETEQNAAFRDEMRFFMGSILTEIKSTKAITQIFLEKSRKTGMDDKEIEMRMLSNDIDERLMLENIRSSNLSENGKYDDLKVTSLEEGSILVRLIAHPRIFENESILNMSITSFLERILEEGKVDTTNKATIYIEFIIKSSLSEDEEESVRRMISQAKSEVSSLTGRSKDAPCKEDKKRSTYSLESDDIPVSDDASGLHETLKTDPTSKMEFENLAPVNSEMAMVVQSETKDKRDTSIECLRCVGLQKEIFNLRSEIQKLKEDDSSPDEEYNISYIKHSFLQEQNRFLREENRCLREGDSPPQEEYLILQLEKRCLREELKFLLKQNIFPLKQNIFPLKHNLHQQIENLQLKIENLDLEIENLDLKIAYKALKKGYQFLNPKQSRLQESDAKKKESTVEESLYTAKIAADYKGWDLSEWDSVYGLLTPSDAKEKESRVEETFDTVKTAAEHTVLQGGYKTPKEGYPFLKFNYRGLDHAEWDYERIIMPEIRAMKREITEEESIDIPKRIEDMNEQRQRRRLEDFNATKKKSTKEEPIDTTKTCAETM